MTDEPLAAEEALVREQAAEYAVEDVTASESGSPAETVKDKLKAGLEEAQASVSDSDVDEIAEKISSGDASAAEDVKSKVRSQDS